MTLLAEKVAHVKSAKQTRKHGCHWPGCKQQVPPAQWGCASHWYKLPRGIRDRIWRAYEPGQEISLSPSQDYIAAATDAQDWIATQVKS